VLARFRLSLIARPEFAVPGRDIVIEWGNARYQRLLDRYVASDSVLVDSLRLVWRNSIGNLNGIFDSPIYEDFVTAVRAVNRALPERRRLRLLACDPPIEWDRVRVRQDVGRFANSRDEFCANVIEREVLARGRSALLILGGGHLLRGGHADGAPAVNVVDVPDRTSLSPLPG
jgi:hypothetical protein